MWAICYLLLYHLYASAVPLAIGITPSESVDALTKLFTAVKKVLPEGCFHGKGREQGPQGFMIDDSVGLQAALNYVWPQYVLLKLVSSEVWF